MRFIIYGAGGIGGSIGGELHLGGFEVVFIDVGEHIQKIIKDGLRLRGLAGDHIIKAPAAAKITDVEMRPDDVIFLVTKSPETREAVEAARGHVDPETPIFCFQNGVRNEEVASEYFNNVYGGVVLFSGTHITPGEVIHTVDKGLGIGKYPDGLDEMAETVVRALTDAGFKVTTSPEIMKLKWRKVFMNLGNGVFASTDICGQEIAWNKKLRGILADVQEEAYEVTNAAGIELGTMPGLPPVEKVLEHFRTMEDKPKPDIPEHMLLRPSTWQDVFLKRGRTELDSFYGEIVRLGREHGIPTPVNQTLFDIVEEMVREGEPPGKYTLDEVIDRVNAARS
jgi:2-dehydropantoate 2-reductase